MNSCFFGAIILALIVAVLIVALLLSQRECNRLRAEGVRLLVSKRCRIVLNTFGEQTPRFNANVGMVGYNETSRGAMTLHTFTCDAANADDRRVMIARAREFAMHLQHLTGCEVVDHLQKS